MQHFDARDGTRVPDAGTGPMARTQRPDRDERVLTDLGFKVEIQRDIGRFVYGDWEKALYAESPLFEICAMRLNSY